MAAPVAFVTGASRGIGRAAAIALAEAGFDVAITARSIEEGEARDHSPTQQRTDLRPIPGSLEHTAAAIKRANRRALVVASDLTDRASLKSAVSTVLAKWGRIDVLVNSGCYTGPGEMDPLLDTALELIDVQLEANLMAPVTLMKAVLSQMIERGNGTIITISADAAVTEPDAPAGRGGPGFGFAVSKGAIHRAAGVLAAELGDQGVCAFNIQPGLVATDRMMMDMEPFGIDAAHGAPPEVVGKVVAWLSTDPAAARYNGRTIEAQACCAELGLLPGWELVRT